MSHLTNILQGATTSTAADTRDSLPWGLCIGLLAVPMLVDALVRPLALGPDYGVARAGVVLAEVAIVTVWLASVRTVRIPQRLPVLGLVLLSGWVIASVGATVTAAHPVPALLRSAEWVGHGLFGAVLWAELQQGEGRMRHAQHAIALGFAGLTLLIVAYAWQLPDAAGYDWIHRIPYLGALGHARYFGMYALTGFVFATRSLLDPVAPFRARSWAVGGMTVAWAVMFWTGGRGSVGAGLVAAVVLWWFAREQRMRFAKGLLISLVAGALVSLCVPTNHHGLGLWRILGLGAVGDASAFTSGRTELWLTALDAWKQQLWLGVGPGASSYVLSAYGHLQPHNVVIQALVEWGVLGTVAFVALLAMLLHRALRNARLEATATQQVGRAVATAYLFGATANAMLDGVFYDSRSLLLVAAAAAMALQPVAATSLRRCTLPTGVKRSLFGIAATLGLLFALHLVAVRAVWLPETPAPDSPRVTLLKAFPSPSQLRPTTRWTQEWKAEHPEAALELAEWGSRHAHLAWFHLRHEADLLRERGLQGGALVHYAEANRREEEAKRYVRQ